MKFILTLLSAVLLSFSVNAQKGLYIKYEIDITATDNQDAMITSMMQGSTMELAFSANRTFAKTTMGSMMTMSIQYEVEKEDMLMLMSGMMGNMAFQGNASELEEETEEADEKAENKFELIKETRKIMGYKCKKGIIRDAEGNKSTYWYTEDIARPDGLNQMPDQIPGLCLEMTVISKEGMTMKYAAVDIKEDINMGDFAIKIPEGVEVKTLQDLKAMGGGF